MTEHVVTREGAYELANAVEVGDEFTWYDRSSFVEVTGEVDNPSSLDLVGYDDPERVFEAEGSRGGEYYLVVADNGGSFKEAVVFYRGSGKPAFEAGLQNGFTVEWGR